MARCAFLLEGAMMRVGVAVNAARKLQAFVLGRLAGAGGHVAVGAGDFSVEARKRVPGLGMVEVRDVLPRGRVMTGLAIFAELALVEVFMARQAGLRDPQETPVQILVLDQFLPLGRDARRVVALFALDGGVLAFQLVACLVVIKLFERWFPADQLEFFSVVFGMAACAVLVRVVFLYHDCVVSLVGFESLIDFAVALEAVDASTGRGKTVAAGALRYTGDGLMSFSQRPRRNLPVQISGSPHEQKKQRHDRMKNSDSRDDCQSLDHSVRPLCGVIVFAMRRSVNLFSCDAA